MKQQELGKMEDTSSAPPAELGAEKELKGS